VNKESNLRRIVQQAGVSPVGRRKEERLSYAINS
jgi:hypothetical protein